MFLLWQRLPVRVAEVVLGLRVRDDQRLLLLLRFQVRVAKVIMVSRGCGDWLLLRPRVGIAEITL